MSRLMRWMRASWTSACAFWPHKVHHSTPRPHLTTAGDNLMRMQQWSDAAELFSKAITLAPINPALYASRCANPNIYGAALQKTQRIGAAAAERV